MAITTYSELQTAISTWLHRSDLSTSQIKEFISLAEADLKVRAKLTQWDSDTSVSVTSGTGTLPSGFSHMISARWGSETSLLEYLTPNQFKAATAAISDSSGTPTVFTIIGDTLYVAPTATGTAYTLCTIRFTSLSDSATTNDLLTLFPDAYLHGSLMYANIWTLDDAATAKHSQLFEAAINRIKKYMLERKYPDGLVMRAA